jgi:hypothetical protein
VKLFLLVYLIVLVVGLVYAWRFPRAGLQAPDPDEQKLRALRDLGIDLKPRQDVTFELILWKEASARRVASELEGLGFRTVIEGPGVDGEWYCRVVQQIRIELPTLRELRVRFRVLAEVEGGRYEGWELGDVSSDEAPAA